MPTPALAGPHSKSERGVSRRAEGSRLNRDLQVLVFLLMPLLVASVAVLLMGNVMRASSRGRRVGEVVARMRVAAMRIEDQDDDAALHEVPDRAAIASDVACFDRALVTLRRAQAPSAAVVAGRSVAAADLDVLNGLWARVRPDLLAWSRGNAAAARHLAPDAALLSSTTERLASDFYQSGEADQHRRLVLVGVLLLLQVMGLLVGAIAKLVDVRSLRRREQELANISRVTERTGSAILVCGPDGRARWANDAFLRTTGWAAAEIESRHAMELLCTHDCGSDAVAGLGAAMGDFANHTCELQLRRRDGTCYWASLELMPLVSETGDVRQLALMFSNVTERVEATRAMQASELRFRSALGAMSESFLLLDADGTILQTNEAARRLLGLVTREGGSYYAEAATWHSVREDGTPVAVEDLPTAITLRTGVPQTDSIVGIPAPGGDRRWISINTSPFELPGEGRRGVVAIIADITARRRAEEDLRLLTSVVADSPTMVMITDTDDRLEYVNSSFERRTGWTSDQVRGRTPEFMLNDLTPAETWTELMATLESGGAWRGEVYNTTRSGETWLAISQVFVLHGADGRVSHHVAMLQDITAQRRREEELSHAREAALAAARAKNEFLQNMSHELRTPLNGILGVSELLLHSLLEPEQRADLVLIRRSAEDLLTVITHLFDFARIEAGGVARESVPFRLRGCIGDVEASLASDAEARGLRWRVEVADALPDVCIGDPGALRQVLLCLTSNAVKFTERGEVSLRVLAEPGPTPDGRPRARFEMRDSGIGIPRDRQVEIFEAFQQLDGSTTRKYGGIGVGLALATRLVQQLGGSLDVSSAQAQGSTFSFVIPLQVATEAVQREVESAAAPRVPAPLGERRVLLVSAATPARKTTLETLERAGGNADVAAGAGGPGAAALALSGATAEGRPYRALVVDQRDGDFDGFAFFAALRAVAGDALPPSLLFTSAGERGDAARCRELGIAGYLSSPADDNELVEALRHIRPVTAEATPLVTRHLLREGFARRRALVVDDNAVNRKVASRMLERSGYETATAVHGGDAVEQFREGGWDVVLMDVQMPEMDGLEATRQIRRLESEGGLGRTPILAVTAHTLESDRRAVLEAGMDELVPKPIVADHLLSTIQRYLADAPLAVPGVPAPPAIEDVIDWKEALERMDGDAQVLDQLLRIFLADSGNIMTRLEDARESGDAGHLERAAHGLKGASGTISARHVESLSRTIEELARSGRMNEARDRFDDLRREMQRLVHVLESLPPPPRQEEAA